MAEQYRTVAQAGVHEAEINRARFLCSLAPAATEQEAQAFITRVRKEHPTATHNCYAYVVGADAGIQKASDDTALELAPRSPTESCRVDSCGPGRGKSAVTERSSCWVCLWL